jgi:hypothetical protein
MKTPGFLFTMIGCAVLMHEVGYADPSSATVSDHQPGSSLLVVAAHGEPVGNKIVNNHTLSVVPFTGSSFKNEHNRDSNPAIIGGPANSSLKNSLAAINGTGMKHKP